ncbi:RNA polymerase ii mediator complex component [Colletotrichum plurivorum]|uniref:RNA polymerase ii mediator complex component n=1 Tax=Colletotrichum plurivorum TaxID=2175906 RepID=A0A8H6NBB0_9PEZI|nr:RNA polymerase ii mediator complex component [Colletotrichum plurivorum]
MARPSKQKACLACTSSKRRCDKGTPSCTRCEDRDIDCRYPPSKRRRREQQHPMLDAAASVEPAVITTSSTAAPATDLFALDAGPLSFNLWNTTPWTDIPLLPSAPIPQEQRYPTPAPMQNPLSRRRDIIEAVTRSTWFLSPSSWTISHRHPQVNDVYPTRALTNFTRAMQSWILRWVTDGHNPFIHRGIYASPNPFPPLLQDALALASLYHHSTPQNESLVIRILDEKVSAMITSQTPSGSLETRDHLARVQALLIYTVLRLFDGSVRHRAAAESHIPTLVLWSSQLWETASHEAQSLRATFTPASTQCPVAVALASGVLVPEDADLAAWYLWIVSESVRRTWLAVTCTVDVYLALKGGDRVAAWQNPGGGVKFTARAGLWDAPSPARWSALYRKLEESDDSDGGAYFLQSFDSDKLFVNAAAADVDEFARLLYTVVWGLDRVEGWALRTSASGEVCPTY